MSKEQAILFIFQNKGWLWRRVLIKNISNGKGIGMIESATREAEYLHSWVNHYADFKEKNL